MTENFLFAFFVTLLTGLATSIGGFAAFFVKKNEKAITILGDCRDLSKQVKLDKKEKNTMRIFRSHLTSHSYVLKQKL